MEDSALHNRTPLHKPGVFIFPRSFLLLSSIIVRQLSLQHQVKALSHFFVVLCKYTYYVFMFTLGQFTEYQFYRQLVSFLLSLYDAQER